jgi:hypothetical protein
VRDIHSGARQHVGSRQQEHNNQGTDHQRMIAPEQ